MDPHLLILGASAALAGFIDAIVGGGGLILVPALFATFPSELPANLLGSNKAAAIWGTGSAMISYVRRVRIPWLVVLPAAISGLVGSLLGAYAITRVQASDLRAALPFILAAVFLYTVSKKDLGSDHQPRLNGWKAKFAGAIGGGCIGFYDGFFGPGTGNFLVFLFVRVFGFDFLHATASAKVVNVACNLAALMYFGANGHVIWRLAGLLAVCNIGGSIVGTLVSLRKGNAFVRSIFLVVVASLIAKSAWNAMAA